MTGEANSSVSVVPMWLAFAFTVLGVGAPSLVQGQLPGEIERDHLTAELRRYYELIADYRRGKTDVAERVLVWDEKRIHRVLSAIEGPNDETRPWTAVRFKAAAMMHTDAAVRLLEHGEKEAAILQIDRAGRLLMKGGPDVRPYAARWYRATALLLRTRGSPAIAEKFLETARERLPRDSIVLYESGVLQEVLARDMDLPNVIYLPDLKAPPPIASAGNLESSAAPTREDVDDLRRHRTERLNKAAAWLRESLEADGANMLAMLHLGRVHYLRNLNNDALKLLGQASASEDSAVAYLALLFTGALQERAGLREAAAQAYRAAIERYPLNHAAYVALSAVLQRSGHGDEARTVLTRTLDATVASRRDPWWTYLVAHSSASVVLFDLLRREIRE